MTSPQTTARSTGWTPDDSTFGARLALVRQRMGWGNVKEAATECGLPPESWRTWERDNVVPRRVVEIAALIAEKTGCDYGWLLAGPSLKGRGAAGALTTVPKSLKPVSPGPRGRQDRTGPAPSTRRPGRISLVTNR